LEEATITGETPRLWVVGSKWAGATTPKKGGDIREGRTRRGAKVEVVMTEAGRALWETQREQARWASIHRHRIATLVSHCSDHGTLQRIAEIVGYEVRE
jgi:hypothetical protein